MHRFLLRAVCLLMPTILSFLASPSFAQDDEEDAKPLGPTPYRGAQYFLGEKDELLMRVNIWGFVRKPGQYMVPTDTDLISLMSFAGGPVEEAKIKSIKIVRALEPEINTTSAASGMNGHINQANPGAILSANEARGKTAAKVLTVDVKKYIATGDAGLIPPLQPGDTVVVTANSYASVKKVLDLVTRVAILGQLYFWLNR